jgi:uncharacterized protein YkwD
MFSSTRNNRSLTHAVIAVLAACTLATATPAAAHAQAAPACAGADVVPTQATIPAAIVSVTCLVNVERAARGRRQVTRNSLLAKAAAAFASDMVARNYLSHVSPTGGTMTTRLAKVHFGRDKSWSAGEIIGAGSGSLGTPAELVSSWLASPEHRGVLLDRTLTQLGAGVAIGVAGEPDTTGATYAIDFGTIR